MPDHLDNLLRGAMDEFMEAVTPQPAGQVRAHGDRRCRMTALRALLTVVVLAAGGAWAARAAQVSSQSSLSAAGPGKVLVAYSATCRTAGDCWLVGYQAARRGTPETGLTEHWNGSRWSVVPSPASVGSLIGIACPGAKDCWAITGSLSAEHWNGRKWSLTQIGVPAGATGARLTGSLACPSATQCWAVGNMSVGHKIVPWMERWNGTSWSLEQVPARNSTSVLTSVSCAARLACMATGWWESPHGLSGGVLAELWNGSVWSIAPDPTPKHFEIGGVSCATMSSCVAVGIGGRHSVTITYAQVWNGSSWSAGHAAGPGRSGLNQVSCVSASWCIAVGSYSTPNTHSFTLAERWNGSSWTITPTPTVPGKNHRQLLVVTCASRVNCLAVGATTTGSFLERWNGTHWSVVG